jgi:uncharacterized protein (TIGR02391 family)
MAREMFERIRQFQEFLLESGVARGTLASAAPRTSIDEHSLSGNSLTVVFGRIVTEPEIVEVSRDLFASGHFNIAVEQAYKAIDKYVLERAGDGTCSGTRLMENVFSPEKPKLKLSELRTLSQKDEQKGYHRLYSGAMLGIRNPTTHEFDWIDDAETALELLVFAQHLLRKAKRSAAGT